MRSCIRLARNEAQRGPVALMHRPGRGDSEGFGGENLKTIVYLCYGAGDHVLQARFSIASMMRFRSLARAGVQTVVYTDDPSAFEGLDVRLQVLSQETLHAWLGGGDYIHRRKTMSLIDALERFGGSAAFIDSDTYFLKSPVRLFDRFGPGRACLHVNEGTIIETGSIYDAELGRLLKLGSFTDLSGAPISFIANPPMWNSGVIGLHADQIDLLREAVHLTDQIWKLATPFEPYGERVHHAEQFATAFFLQTLPLRECIDVVYHYWLLELRAPFKPYLSANVCTTDVAFDRSRARSLYANRPREALAPRLKNRAKMVLRRVLRQAGLTAPGFRRSA